MIENCSQPATAFTYDPAKKREWSAAERKLLPVALLIAVLFDRLIFEPLFSFEDIQTVKTLAGAFWLCYLITF